MNDHLSTNFKTQQCVMKLGSSGVVFKTDGCFHHKNLLLLCLRAWTWLILMPRLPLCHAALTCFLFCFILAACFQQQNENTVLSRKQVELNAAPRDSIVHFIAFCKDEWKQQPWIPERRRSIPAPVQFFWTTNGRLHGAVRFKQLSKTPLMHLPEKPS